MKCDVCNQQFRYRRAEGDRPYSYVVDGVRMYLRGIRVMSCACGENADIPRQAALHRLIASALIESGETLTGDHIRFLRKFCGFSSKDFAAKLGIEPETMSRIETGKQGVTGTVDQFVRMLARATRDAKQEAGNLLTTTDPRREPAIVEWVWRDNRWHGQDRKAL